MYFFVCVVEDKLKLGCTQQGLRAATSFTASAQPLWSSSHPGVVLQDTYSIPIALGQFYRILEALLV